MFNDIVFTAFGAPVSYAELLGFITGLWTVYLCVKQRVLNFPIGIANAIFFFILFEDARLYSDAWLQMVYVVLLTGGWWAWLKAGPNRSELRVGYSSGWMLLGILIFMGSAEAILYPILKNAHDVYPFWDSITTSLSLGAQLLLSLKRIENWILWIVADVIYIPLYLYKSLYLTSIVYVCFLVLCFAGLYQWTNVKKKWDRGYPGKEMEPSYGPA